MDLRSLLNKLNKMENNIITIYEDETDEYFYFTELGVSLVLSDSELNRLYDNGEQYRQNYVKALLLSEEALEVYLDSLEFIELAAYYLFDLTDQGYKDEAGDVYFLAALSTSSTELWKEEIA